MSHAPATGMLLRLIPQMTAGPDIIDNISLRARMTYLAHLYKACMKQHHRPLMPALGIVTLIKYRPNLALLSEAKRLKMHMATISE
ncbi:MAG: hypothetical protein V3T66_08605 [Alphaproteobacteria bacterium]